MDGPDLAADRNKLQNEVATLNRVNNMSSETKKAIVLIKELLVEKKNFEM